MKETKFKSKTDSSRMRVPAHISESSSGQFGLEVSVKRLPVPKSETLYHSGSPQAVGLKGGPEASTQFDPGNRNFREVIPPGQIGTEEKFDMPLPPPQYVDTCAWYPEEDKDQSMHGSVNAMRMSDKPVPFQQYSDFQSRRAPMPRALQDEAGFARGAEGKRPGSEFRLGADPLMSGEDSYSKFIPRDDYLRKDLYGPNVAGFLHNDDTQMVKGFHQASQPNSYITGRIPGAPDPKAVSEAAKGSEGGARYATQGPRKRTAMKGEPNTRGGGRGHS